MLVQERHNHQIVSKNIVECERVPGCIAAALEVLGDKWSPLLLKQLAENGSLKFSELELAFPGLSPRTLSQRLYSLCDADIVDKMPCSLHPIRFEYGLSPKGRDLVQVLRAMADWGEKYSASTVC